MATDYTYKMILPTAHHVPPPGSGCVDAALGIISVEMNGGTAYPPINRITHLRNFAAGDTLNFVVPKTVKATMNFTMDGTNPINPWGAGVTSGMAIETGTILTFQNVNTTVQIWFQLNLIGGTNWWLIPDPEVQVGTGS